jgi:UDP-N-acetylmuramate dehydrogenase
MTILQNILLAPYTTLKVGGHARYFVSATTSKDVREAVLFAKQKKLPLFVLGGGSNVLIPDSGFSGLVMHMQSEDILWEAKGDSLCVIVDAGVTWDTFVAMCVSHEQFGLENLSGIPGSVGASVVQNIGAYGVEVSERVEWIEVYDSKEDRVRRVIVDGAQFGYRESVFKHDAGKQLIVLRVAFLLSQKGTLSLGYKDIESYARDVKPIVSLADMRKAILAIRGRKFPDLEKFGTAGSFFKNPIVEPDVAASFLARFPDSPHYSLENGKVKLSAAWIIDRILHMRGVHEGNVGTWSEQALVLINYGNASAREIQNFAAHIQERALHETHIILETEVVYIENKKNKK